MNRSEPGPGADQATVHAVAGTATAVTLPSDALEGETVFLHHDVFQLPARDTSVAAARRRVGERLCEWGVAEPVHENAALIVSELFTNALVHTDSAEIICRVQTTLETVYLAITDQGHGVSGPEVREPEEEENGRGLLLVNALAELWGVRSENGYGRTVWAVLPSECDEPKPTDA